MARVSEDAPCQRSARSFASAKRPRTEDDLSPLIFGESQPIRKIMRTKVLKGTLVCWPKPVLGNAVDDASILEPGETVQIRETESLEAGKRVPVLARGKILYCNSNQLLSAVK
jgi:hypothetical protein